MDTEYKLTNLELAILGLISEEPRHGYRIEADIERRGMREWTDIGFSSIYQALKKLEASGLLESELHQEGAGPARKVYRPKPAGLCSLAAAVRRRLSGPRPNSGDFDLGLAYLPVLPAVEQVSAISAHRQTLGEKITQIKLKMEQDGGEHLPPHVRALFGHSLALMAAELAWLENWLDQNDQNIPKEEK
jgi:DNA-binding PadR family transcriptional regulator